MTPGGKMIVMGRRRTRECEAPEASAGAGQRKPGGRALPSTPPELKLKSNVNRRLGGTLRIEN